MHRRQPLLCRRLLQRNVRGVAAIANRRGTDHHRFGRRVRHWRPTRISVLAANCGTHPPPQTGGGGQIVKQANESGALTIVQAVPTGHCAVEVHVSVTTGEVSQRFGPETARLHA